MTADIGTLTAERYAQEVEPPRPLTIGVIGLGYWGPNLARNASVSGRTELAWLCDRDPDRLVAIGAHYPAVRRTDDPADLLADPTLDAVAIATPVATHFELARRAIEAGKHVLVEKPFTATVAQAEELVELARRSGVTLMVDHIFLYSPAVRRLSEIVASGELGELQFVDSVRINLGLFQNDVNVAWDLAPHDLSIMDHLIGRAPRSVVAIGTSHYGMDLRSVSYLHLDYGDNLLASVHVNWLSPVKIRHFIVGGTRQSVIYNDLDPSEPIKLYDRGVDLESDPEGRRAALVSYRSGNVISPRVEQTEPLRTMIEHFADCAQSGGTPISSAEQGLRLVRILEAADESMRRGGAKVELP